MRLNRALIVSLLTFVSVWGALPDESAVSNSVIINEINLNDEYIELYFNQDQAIDGWQLWVNEQSGGSGGTTQYSCTLSGSFTQGTYLVVPDNIGCAFALHQNTNEVLLLDENNATVHYVSIWHAGHVAKEWPYDGGEDFTTVLDGVIGGNPTSVCSIPDGDQSEAEWGVYSGGTVGNACYPSPGFSNSLFDGSSFSGESPRTFSKLYQVSLNGSIALIGNTILGGQECLATTMQCYGYKHNGVCYGIEEEVCTKYGSDTGCPLPGEDNGGIDARYFDMDSDSGTFSSSSANLTIPDGAVIHRAYLIWQGILQADQKDLAKTVKFKAPGSNKYTVIATDETKLNWTKITTIPTYYPYQGMADITRLINGSGTYTVADLHTTEGNIFLYGSFGAWAIFVVYENSADSFKNITLYDGYDIVGDNIIPFFQDDTLNTTLSGFLTPTHGTVKSNFLVFAGEGDKSWTPDYVKIDGTKLSNTVKDPDNTFDSTITQNGVYFTDKSPNCTNNMGIDIHTFDVGSTGQKIISNSQTSAQITLGSGLEYYYPGLFAFSTDLYVPDVCYEENITKDGVPVTELYVGDVLDFNVTITNKNIEPAHGVSIAKYFSFSDEYVAGSTAIKPSSGGDYVFQTDAVDGDEASYDSNVNDTIYDLKLNLGTGANALEGGDIALDQEEMFHYRMSVRNTQSLVSEYKVSYRDESDPENIVTHESVAIGKCSNRSETSTTLTIEPVGNVRIVEHGKGWSDDGGSLLTKIVGVATEYDILYATDDTGTELTSGYIKKLELADAVSGASIQTLIDTQTEIDQQESVNFTFTTAQKNVLFKATLLDDTTATSSNFSIRPAALTVHAVTGMLKAGETYLNKLALSAAEGYNQSVVKLTVFPNYIDLDGNNDGPKGSFTLEQIIFEGAEPVYPDIDYSDVGRIELRLEDALWTYVDRESGDCISGSCSNTAESDGRVGCNICGTVDNNLTFIPYEFNITFPGTPRLDDNSSYTYYANDLNMSAVLSGLDLHIEARNKQGDKTENYTDRTAGGYEKDITLDLDINVSSLSQVTLRLADGIDLDFIDGAADITVDSRHFNYGKDNQNPRNPVKILGNDVNLSVSISDSDSVKGPFFKPGVDGGATFFYGRINPIDRNCIQGLVCPVTVNYEVYCNGCDQGAFGMAGWTESVNDVNWYVNPNHLADQLVSGASLPFANSTYDNHGSQILNYTNFPTGRKRVTVQHTDNIQAPSYLYYHPYSDQNISSFYLDAMENVTPVAPDNVIDNKGDITIGGSRIGE